MLSKLRRKLSHAEVQICDRIRHIKHSGRTIQSNRGPLTSFVRDSRAPWLKIAVEPIDMPGMITDEEAQYYEWIGTLYQARGAAIELGPWLGKSTRHIVRGLKKRSRFDDRPLHVFDDFIWRSSWMDQYVSDDLRRPNHASFREIFEGFVGDDRGRLQVSTAKISDYEGNEHLPNIAWNAQPIEVMNIDCGRTFEVNERWFQVFSPGFIPEVTFLVMQDWGTHRERPRLSFNQTLQFTNAHPEMQLVHELCRGAVATFLYRDSG